MTHFVVLVIGDNPDQQLTPYHQFECTGTVDQYVQDVDETEDFLQSHPGPFADRAALEAALDAYHGEQPILSPTDTPDIHGSERFSYAVADGATLIRVVRRTNPQGRWDWYTPGGRWSGWIPSTQHQPDRPDSMPAGCIDWDALAVSRRTNMEEEWDRFHRVIEAHDLGPILDMLPDPSKPYPVNHPVSEPESYSVWRAMTQHLDIRDIWYGHITLWNVHNTLRNEYIREHTTHLIVPKAIIHQGRWYDDDTVDTYAETKGIPYPELCTKILRGLSPDTCVNVIDCHV